MKWLKILLIALVMLTCLETIISVLVILAPLRVFTGGVEGFFSLYKYRISFLGEPIESELLNYVNKIAPFATIPYVILQLATIVIIIATLNRKVELPELSFYWSLTSIPHSGVLIGLTLLSLRELSRIPLQIRLSTTAGIITFPETQVSIGPAQYILVILLIVIFIKVVIGLAMHIHLARVEAGASQHITLNHVYP